MFRDLKVCCGVNLGKNLYEHSDHLLITELTDILDISG